MSAGHGMEEIMSRENGNALYTHCNSLCRIVLDSVLVFSVGLVLYNIVKITMVCA